jgi:hypothetical protein
VVALLLSLKVGVLNEAGVIKSKSNPFLLNPFSFGCSILPEMNLLLANSLDSLDTISHECVIMDW